MRSNNPDTYGFVVTKPLQLMIVLAIIEQIQKEVKKEILIVDSFHDAEGISNRMKAVYINSINILFVDNEISVYKIARKRKYAMLFIDSDVGFRRNLTLMKFAFLSPKTKLAVYEEGIGTYRCDLYSGIKKTILRSLGCGVYFGDNWCVKELYVYRPESINSSVHSKKIKIEKEIYHLLKERQKDFEFIFDVKDFFSIVTRKATIFNECTVYLSDWSLDSNVISFLEKISELVIIKPHPHIKDVGDLSFKGSIVAPARIPAEMLLMHVTTLFPVVNVYHYGSSAFCYMADCENLNINLLRKSG